MSQKLTATLDIVKLVDIYSEMTGKVNDLQELLTVAKVRMESHDYEDPKQILSYLQQEQIPLKIEALVGEIVDLLNQEKKESKKLPVVAEEETWNTERLRQESIIKTIISDLTKVVGPKINTLSPIQKNTLIPIGYSLYYEFSNGQLLEIWIKFLKPAVGGLFQKVPVSEDNYREAKLNPPTVEFVKSLDRVLYKDLNTKIRAYFINKKYKLI